MSFRFAQDQIDALLEIRWWDWPINRIRSNAHDFDDIVRFINKHKNKLDSGAFYDRDCSSCI